jgi:molecular chaperone GrpE
MAERKKRNAFTQSPDEHETESVHDEAAVEEPGAAAVEAGQAAGEGRDDTAKLSAEVKEANDKYLRLYAEMENYKKKVRKDKEEFLAYCHEDLLYELLPVLDTLEMAIMHSAKGNDEALDSLKTGVENTLREFLRTLEKFGLKPITALGRPFDPSYHHAMAHLDSADAEPGHIVQEMRKGYVYKEKVLRPSLVAVAKRPQEDNHQ